MYLSLKGSLGHTAITDRVGESLLQIAEGSSAAYSLRNLGSDSPSVVRVRRESDNAERDFSAQDINTSVVENWVNQQIIPPLDLRELTPTGRDGPLIPAAAAYSLRNLSNSYTGNVVEVRRTSDDQVRSFTAVEVSNGTLLDWVNADIDKLDLQPESGGLIGNVTNKTTTGFDFSVNNEGADGYKNLLPTANVSAGNYTVTLDVVLNSGNLTGCNLYHTSSGAGVVTPLTAGANSIILAPDANTNIFFYTTAAAVADVSITNITLTQTTADGHVSTWYDQSGNTKHATQATPASQPKIVSGGSLVSGGLDFDGVDDRLTCPSLYSSDISVFNVVTTSNTVNTSNYMRMIHLCDGSNSFQLTRGGSVEIGKLSSKNTAFQGGTSAFKHGDINGINLISAVTSSTDTDAYIDGSLQSNESSSLGAGNNVTTTIGARDDLLSSTFFAGSQAEIIIYPSDQSDNRTAFEANIGEVYGIAGIPAYDNTVNGFVETWYDQSGNGNNASQLTASQQPKIVDAGVLVTDRDGKVALNGKGAKLDLPNDIPMLSADGTYSLFAVVDFDDQRNGNDQFNNILRFDSKTLGGASSVRKPLIYLNQGNGHLSATGPSYTSGGVNYTVAETLSVQLLTNIANPALLTGNNTLYKDGVLVSSSDLATDVNTETRLQIDSQIFDNQETTVTHFLSEVIYYPSDESANRPAIEDNIDNHYGITSAGSYVNAAGDSYINAAGDTYLQP